MKILHVVPTYLPATRYGGPIYSVHGLCRALAALGHEVHVYTTSVDGAGDSAVALDEPVLLDGVRVWYFRSPLLRRLYWSPAMQARLRRDLARFDIVHLHSVFLWPTAVAAREAQRRGIPYVLSPRGMLVPELIRRKSRWLKQAWLTLVEARTIREAALLHFTAEIERQDFVRCGFEAQRSCVLANGIDAVVPVHADELSDDVRSAIAAGPYLLFLGRLNWKKGLDRLIPALAEVPDQRLLIVGNDEEGYCATITALVAAAGVADRVCLLPRFVQGADKQALYAAARLFVLPSHSENFGNTVVEAMAAACPVLVTQEVGAADIVRAAACGAVCEGAALGATLRQLLDDLPRLQAMGRAGQHWVQAHLTWDAIARQMAEQYRLLVPAASGASA